MLMAISCAAHSAWQAYHSAYLSYSSCGNGERDLFPFWLYKATMEMVGSVLVTLLSLSTRE